MHKGIRRFLGLIATIYRYVGKQEIYLKQKPLELEKLVEIAKIQSTEASNAIKGIDENKAVSLGKIFLLHTKILKAGFQL